jgi:hypothetical protein
MLRERDKQFELKIKLYYLLRGLAGMGEDVIPEVDEPVCCAPWAILVRPVVAVVYLAVMLPFFIVTVLSITLVMFLQVLCVFVRVCVRLCVRVHVHVRTCLHVCVQVLMCVCVCLCLAEHSLSHSRARALAGAADMLQTAPTTTTGSAHRGNCDQGPAHLLRRLSLGVWLCSGGGAPHASTF